MNLSLLKAIWSQMWSHRIVQATAYILLAALLSVLIGATLFVSRCRKAQPEFARIPSVMTATTTSTIHGYARDESSTYLTYPEWYLVFNPQEYAQYITSYPPSGFPYFTSIKQFWSGYCSVYGITGRNFAFNAGDHLMLGVIGVSFSVEYLLKEIYENTVGRLSEWSAQGQMTEEDRYAAKVATRYGAFVPDNPWFEFPFGGALVGLWHDSPILGANEIRKLERRFDLSMEYGVKAVYALLIGYGSHQVLGYADTTDYLSASAASTSALEVPDVHVIKSLGEDAYIISVPHYQGFTDTLPALAANGVTFHNISGNSEILLTVRAPSEWKYDLAAGTDLFEMDLLYATSSKRVAIQVPVSSLSTVLRSLNERGITVEHLFDY